MNTPNQLDQSIEALRNEHRSIAPPSSLQASILKQAALVAPHRNHALRNWSLAFGAAAALAVAIVLLFPRPSHPTLHARTPAIETPKAVPPSPPLHIAVQPAEPHPLPKRRPSHHRQNSPDAFVLLPTGVGLPEPTQAMIVRTRIDTSSLRSYGLTPPPPGAPQTVLAEFLVGEDGLPRAVRLVP